MPRGKIDIMLFLRFIKVFHEISDFLNPSLLIIFKSCRQKVSVEPASSFRIVSLTIQPSIPSVRRMFRQNFNTSFTFKKGDSQLIMDE
jgi:hypothetical protein